MRQFFLMIVIVVLAHGVTACGGTSAAGAVESDQALYGFMGAIALDLARVMVAVAPGYDTLAVKQDGSTERPGGGGAAWADSGFGGGTFTLTACKLRGIEVTGTLSGFLDSSPESVNATMMTGPLSTSGGFSGELFVTNLSLQAQLPVADATTYWEVRATDANNKILCAWSGGPGCAPVF